MKITRVRSVPEPLDDEREMAYSIAQALHDLRREKKMTQADLATQSGTRQSNISRFEAAKGGLPTLPFLIKVARVLGARVVVTIEKKESK